MASEPPFAPGGFIAEFALPVPGRSSLVGWLRSSRMASDPPSATWWVRCGVHACIAGALVAGGLAAEFTQAAGNDPRGGYVAKFVVFPGGGVELVGWLRS